MDYLIKMELAKANIARAIDELADVEGLEYILDRLMQSNEELSEEIVEYKQHSDLD